MKRIILSVVVLAFAVAVQAGDAKKGPAKEQDLPACCGGKMKTSTQVKDKEATCPMTKCSNCKQKVVKQTALLSPKAAGAAN